MIYILNKEELIVDILEPQKERKYWGDWHVRDLKEGSETYEFCTDVAVDIPEKATIVLKTPTGEMYPFIVRSITQYVNDDGTRYKKYECDAEFLEIRYTRILEPVTLSGQTPTTALQYGLQGTRWQLGIVESNDVADVEIDGYMTLLKYVRMLSELFNLEMRFRVEFSASTISARYIDLLQRAGNDIGKEILFGKDLQSIERIVDTDPVVTALYGIGPADSNGNIMTIASVNGGKVYVEDMDALQRWGKDGEHLFDTYQPPIDAKNLNPTILLKMTQNELKRRINSVVTYIINAVDMYDVLGWEHERVLLGDTVRIKDEGFTPALYVEARVIRTERSYTDPSRNKYMLGDYYEIDINNYKSIRSASNVLNNSKEKWNAAEDRAVARAQLIITETEESWNATVQSISDTVDGHTSQINQINLDVDGVVLSVSSMDRRVGSVESSLNVLNGEISSKVSQTDFNGNTIASKINQSATTITLDAKKINLMGITQVANELNIGYNFNDNTLKRINFRGPSGGAGIASGSSDHLTISAINVLEFENYGYIRFMGVPTVDFSNATVTGLTVNNATNATYIGGYSAGSLIKSNAGQNIAFQFNGAGRMDIYISGVYRGYILSDSFS